jgi:predicted ATPase/DNA-binding CsgD family transcriptional regulator
MTTDHSPPQSAETGLSNGSAKRYFRLAFSPLSPLIGREHEVQEALLLLGNLEVRLLTITGPGGVGKSRLALEVALVVQREFTDGCCSVGLAHFSTPEQVELGIAQALGLRVRGRKLFERLKTFLREKHLLLLLDNFEQVQAAAPLLSELLLACPRLKILVTSRAVLRLQGEFEFPVLPLSVPDLLYLPSPEALMQYGAVALFVQRARAISSDFRVTAENSSAIAGICARLDGLPLAIELAAAHTKLLPPRQLLARLKRPLDVLTRGGPDLPLRHQTLRDTIAWSYGLLMTEEQRVFRRLSVFVGGCTLEAAEAVCTDPGEAITHVIHVIESLLDQSLLQRAKQESGESRLLMLETIREYGLERLAASGELERARDAHAAYYLSLAEQAEQGLLEVIQSIWIEQLEHERDNLSAALHCLLERKAVEEALRLAGALRKYWFESGHLNEGLEFLERAVSAMREDNVTASKQVRAKALYGISWILYWQSDFERARALAQESLELSRQGGDTRGTASVLRLMGSFESELEDDDTAGEAFIEESLLLFREAGDDAGIAAILLTLGARAFFRGEFARTLDLCRESLTLFKVLGDSWFIAVDLHFLGWASFCQGAHATASRLSEESVALFRTLGHQGYTAQAMTILGCEVAALGKEAAAAPLMQEALELAKNGESWEDMALALCSLGHLALHQGNRVQARARYGESLTVLTDAWTTDRLTMRTRWIPASSLEGLGEMALSQGKARLTAQLFAAAENLRVSGMYRNPIGIRQPYYERTLTEARAQLGEEDFAAFWADGRAMTPEEVLAAKEHIFGSEQVDVSTPGYFTTTPSPGVLTARQVEVLCLLAVGLTNQQIADRLVISRRTVNVHVDSIYKKLGLTSRAAATRYAMERGLA